MSCICRYPLLLDRLYKLTSRQHPDYDRILKAKRKIEDILEHINFVSVPIDSGTYNSLAEEGLENGALEYDIRIKHAPNVGLIFSKHIDMEFIFIHIVIILIES